MNIKIEIDKSDVLIRGGWEMFVVLERRALRQVLHCPRPLHKKYRLRLTAIFQQVEAQTATVAAA